MINHVLVVLVLLSCAAMPALGKSVLYINHAPDVRYSVDGFDSRISFDIEEGLFSYGNDYGDITTCEKNSTSCVSFDFMALYKIPENTSVGSEYWEGSYRFKISRKSELHILGVKYDVFRVDVAKNDKRANSYLWNAGRGVIAIIVLNFENKEIPESIFFLQGSEGIYARGTTPGTIPEHVATTTATANAFFALP